jgi:hypothetical protein
MSALVNKIKANKKPLLIIGGVVVLAIAAYMAYRWWLLNLKPEIISAPPISRADEIAFTDMQDIIKNGVGTSQGITGYSAIINKAGDDFNGNTEGAQWGHSKTGALMGAVDYYYSNEAARPAISGKFTKMLGGWMTEATYNALLDRWTMYQHSAV